MSKPEDGARLSQASPGRQARQRRRSKDGRRAVGRRGQQTQRNAGNFSKVSLGHGRRTFDIGHEQTCPKTFVADLASSELATRVEIIRFGFPGQSVDIGLSEAWKKFCGGASLGTSTS